MRAEKIATQHPKSSTDHFDRWYRGFNAYAIGSHHRLFGPQWRPTTYRGEWWINGIKIYIDRLV